MKEVPCIATFLRIESIVNSMASALNVIALAVAVAQINLGARGSRSFAVSEFLLTQTPIMVRIAAGKVGG
jgi:hypothetical protein